MIQSDIPLQEVIKHQHQFRHIGCVLDMLVQDQPEMRQNNFRRRRRHFDVPTRLQLAGFNQSALHPLRELLLLSRHTASTLHILCQSISQRAQIINIYCTSSPRGHPSSLAPPASPNLCFIYCWCILLLNPIFSFSNFLLHTRPPCISREIQCKPPHLGTFLPLFLSTTLFLPASFT